MAKYSIPVTRTLNKNSIYKFFLIIISILIALLLLMLYSIISHKGIENEGDRIDGYEHCPLSKPGKINIHILAHTHDDVAWQKTFDQYYYGTNSRDDYAAVQFILDSVIDQLIANESRRFVYVEIAFFWRWWNEQTKERQSQVKDLVQRGQLEFAGGGWSMNDEATTNYLSIIDNFTWGFRKVTEMFGSAIRAKPKVGWQIDPFGHSREQASIFAQFGFDGLFINRIDYQDKAARMKTKRAEFLWKTSPNLGKSTDIFTVVMYNHYSPLDGFHYGPHRRNDAIVDEIGNPEYNVDVKVSQILNEARTRSKLYNTNNVYITWGDDFTFQNAHVWFKNIDKIIKNINEKKVRNTDDFHIFYSTPSCFIKSVNSDKNLTLTNKNDDFFPYVMSGYSYWTGYYTSRPTLKYFLRQATNFLQICKQLTVISNTKESFNNYAMDELRSTIALMQHHDAITGTSKSHVVEDYKLRMSKSVYHSSVTVAHAVGTILSHEHNKGYDANNSQFKFSPYLRSNMTECAVCESGQPFTVTLYNPLSHPTTHYVRLPVMGDGMVSYTVLNPQGEKENAQLVPVPKSVISMSGRKSNSTVEILFKAENIPPLGFKSYYIAPSNDLVFGTREIPPADVYTIGNVNRTAVILDGGNGHIKSCIIKGKMYSLHQSYLYYISKDLPERDKPSGVYIFNPKENEPVPVSTSNPEFKVYYGVHVDEIHQKFNDWASQVVRVYKDEDHIEFDWLIGPLGVSQDFIGKEVVIRYKIPELNSNETFFTDSNGREMIRRIRNKRESWTINMGNSTVSSNYYPVTSRIMIQDGETQMSIIPDRPEGGTSLNDGEIELMVHRQLIYDDELGVGEPLIENEFNREIMVRGKHYLTIGKVQNQNADDRLLIERKYNEVWMFLTQLNDTKFSTWNDMFKMEYSGLKTSLPENVRILTLEPWLDGQFLLRIEHFIERNDHNELSNPATISIENLFTPFTISSVKEMTLGANTELNKVRRLKWSSDVHNPDPNDHDGLLLNDNVNWKSLLLNPMQIRTFLISVVFNA
ncbi:lysosomal alpha-mannosidase-like [Lycorma delicatula]|uniref:lysosomal alpha-mannosidase-like n=1 Tax=Lycorma delicatula TaxID=130591 RepID=UPI003F514926